MRGLIILCTFISCYDDFEGPGPRVPKTEWHECLCRYGTAQIRSFHGHSRGMFLLQR
jgi:hypothetical protein